VKVGPGVNARLAEGRLNRNAENRSFMVKKDVKKDVIRKKMLRKMLKKMLGKCNSLVFLPIIRPPLQIQIRPLQREGNVVGNPKI
jgi:hypothetical protein